MIFKALVAQAGAAAAVVADEDGDVVTDAELEELAPLEGAVDELDAEDDEDDEHPAASAAQASTAASRPLQPPIPRVSSGQRPASHFLNARPSQTRPFPPLVAPGAPSWTV